MSFQAYLDNVKAKTGKTPEDFARLAKQKGLAKHGEIVKWLKDEHSLGHGHATAIAGVVLRMGAPKASTEDRASALFAGKKQRWRPACESLIAKIMKFGPGIAVTMGGSYVSLVRQGKKFAILQPASADRLDIGIKLKGERLKAPFEAAGKWNAMVTHRVKIQQTEDINQELLAQLRRAYDRAIQLVRLESRHPIRSRC